jgi:hypothetical protein
MFYVTDLMLTLSWLIFGSISPSKVKIVVVHIALGTLVLKPPCNTNQLAKVGMINASKKTNWS